ncbi:MAG: CRISPR-associated endonuclease Cas2 [Deltaproteobacteria bacterium]|nr:CRISPR-associated endonuclease Cas2 [Deltaproteobacteria bacterium]
MMTYVIYDIESDKVRGKVMEVCKDYGLEHIQFSAFCGFLSRNKGEELFARLCEKLGDKLKGKIIVQAVCDRCRKEALIKVNEAEAPTP